jgi:divalent metal cation (Fe/Co/Zn/Cd) transporter
VSRIAAVRRGVRLELITVVWMAAEAALAIGAGIAARSVLLTAFGLDSVVELLSGLVLLWRLSVEADRGAKDRVERVESTTRRISAVLLVLLCAYVVLSSVAGLATGLKPQGSALGLGVSLVALIGMPLLALAKARANREIGSASLRADIAETATCAYLAGVTLAGLVVSSVQGLWWIQYLAAFALLVWLIPETREAIGGEAHEREEE